MLAWRDATHAIRIPDRTRCRFGEKRPAESAFEATLSLLAMELRAEVAEGLVVQASVRARGMQGTYTVNKGGSRREGRAVCARLCSEERGDGRGETGEGKIDGVVPAPVTAPVTAPAPKKCAKRGRAAAY